MKITQVGIDLIKRFEGCRLKSYQDSVGIWTIGYGATYYQDGRKVKQGEQITQQEADALLLFHVTQFSKGVAPLIHSVINDNQFSALVSFAFNVGIKNLMKSTLLKKVNADPTDPEIAHQFTLWNKAGGRVLAGLTARRKAESRLYFS